MPSIYDIKPAFQSLLRPITRALARAGVTANQVTLFACLVSFVVGAVVWFVSQTDPRVFWLYPITLFVRMALNAIDGMLAREHGQKSKLGGILNELTDVLSDAALYLPFALVTALSPYYVVAIVILAVVSEMTGVVAVAIGASRHYEGPMGKSDRAFVFGVLGILLATGVQRGAWLHIVWSVVLVLLVWTIFNRAHGALREAQPK